VKSANEEERFVPPKTSSKHFAIPAVLLALIFAGTVPFTIAQQPKKAPAPAKPEGMTVDGVIKLVQNNVAEEFIIERIRQANKPIELSDDDLIKLRQNNVSDNIQRVMMNPSAKIVAPPEVPAPPPLPPVPPEVQPSGVPAPGPAPGKEAPAVDPDDPNSPHDPGIYLYAKDASGKDSMTILDRAVPKYPDCVPGRVLNHVEVNFPGGQAAIRTKDTRPVFYFSFENTGGNSQFADNSLSQPTQFTLVPMSTGKKGRQVRLAVQCVAPTKIAIGFKVERIRLGFYKLTLLEPLAAGDYAFFGSGSLPQDVFEFGVDVGSAAMTAKPEVTSTKTEPEKTLTDLKPTAGDLADTAKGAGRTISESLSILPY
jgi:hypothetical protein